MREKKVAAVEKHLRRDSITSLEAFNLYKVTRLADVIHELRTRHGLNIATELLPSGTTRYARYYMVGQ